MAKAPPALAESVGAISVDALQRLTPGWFLDGESAFLSPRTLEARREVVRRLLWFLDTKGHNECGAPELRAFLAYLGTGHLEPGGRWGNPRLTAPLRPATAHLFHRNLKTLFNWLVEDPECPLTVSPIARIKPPVVRQDQIQPFSADELRALFAAARESRYRRRDVLILSLLIDTGARAGELVGLDVADVDSNGRHLRVTGKGNKVRALPLGREALRALWDYLRDWPLAADTPLFCAQVGERAGDRLTVNGLFQLIERLGKRAGVRNAHPHRFRHTFACSFLNSGGHIYALQASLGHTSLLMCQRYLALSQADLTAQHKLHSPLDGLRRER